MKRKTKHRGYIKYDSECIDRLPSLSLPELIAYIVVQNSTQNFGGYRKPLADMAYWLRASEYTARRALQTLVAAGLIEAIVENGKTTKYLTRPLANCDPLTPRKLQPLANCNPSQIATPPLANCDPSHIIYNNKDIKDIDNKLSIVGVEEKAAEKVEEKKEKKARFSKPTIEEIAAYCEERQNGIDATVFYDYYESNGWVVGRNSPMKDWRAAVRNWENRRKERKTTTTHSNGKRDYEALGRAIIDGINLADTESNQ